MLNLKINLKRLSLPIRREYIIYLDLDPLVSWALGRRTCCPTPRAGTGRDYHNPRRMALPAQLQLQGTRSRAEPRRRHSSGEPGCVRACEPDGPRTGARRINNGRREPRRPQRRRRRSGAPELVEPFSYEPHTQ